MAVMRLTCGSCGADLAGGLTHCPQCGSEVELPKEVKAQFEKKDFVCPTCGHKNVNAGQFCEACGTRFAVQGTAKEVKSGTSGKKTGKKYRLKKESSVRPDLPAMMVVLLVVGWLTYDEATRDFPPSDAGHVHQPASSSAATGSPEVEQLQRQADADPQNDQLLLRLANTLQDESVKDPGLLPRAIDNYQKYLERNPSNENARVDLGICYFDLSKSDTAHASALVERSLREMRKVYDANPRHQAAAFNLGIVSLNAGLFTDSMEWLRKASEIDPKSNLGQRAKQLLEQHSFGNSPN